MSSTEGRLCRVDGTCAGSRPWSRLRPPAQRAARPALSRGPPFAALHASTSHPSTSHPRPLLPLQSADGHAPARGRGVTAPLMLSAALSRVPTALPARPRPRPRRADHGHAPRRGGDGGGAVQPGHDQPAGPGGGARGCVGGRVGGWAAGWVGGWVAGWVGGWVAGWVGGWVAGWVGCRTGCRAGWWLSVDGGVGGRSRSRGRAGCRSGGCLGGAAWPRDGWHQGRFVQGRAPLAC